MSEAMMVGHPGMEILSSYLSDGKERDRMSSLKEHRMVIPWPEDFPTELVFAIFKYLSQAELKDACLVSKYWYTIASDVSLWGDIELTNVRGETCSNGIPETLARRLRSVVSLKMAGRMDLPPPVLKEILTLASISPRLTSISLYSAVDVTEEMLIDLFTSTPSSIKHIDLSFCHHIGSDPVLALISRHPNILILNLSHTSFTDDGLLQIHRLTQLTDLSLQGCFNLTRTSMSQFLQNHLPPRLSRLNLSYLFTVLGEWLAQLNSDVKFERLDVRYAENITKRDVRGLKERWDGCEVLSTARLETDDERGWRQYVDEITNAEYY